MRTMRCGEWLLNPRDDAWSYAPSLTVSVEGAVVDVVILFLAEDREVVACVVADGEVAAEFVETYPDRAVACGEEVAAAFEAVLGTVGDWVGCEFPAATLRLPKTVLALIGADDGSYGWSSIGRAPLCSVCHTFAPCSRHRTEVR